MTYAISKRNYTGEYYDFAEVVLHGTMLGFPAGLASGAVAGSFVYPVFGTLIGGLVGAVVGGLLGLPCSLVLGFVSWARPGVVTTRIVSVVVAMAWSTLAVICFGPDNNGDYGFVVYLAFPLAAISAAIVGPRAVFRRPERPPLVPPAEPRRART